MTRYGCRVGPSLVTYEVESDWPYQAAEIAASRNDGTFGTTALRTRDVTVWPVPEGKTVAAAVPADTVATYHVTGPVAAYHAVVKA